MITTGIEDSDKIQQLMTDLEFEEHELSDESSDSWRELKFEFGGGKFEIVIDEINDKKTIIVQLGGSCSEEINRLPLTYTNLLKVLQTWGVI